MRRTLFATAVLLLSACGSSSLADRARMMGMPDGVPDPPPDAAKPSGLESGAAPAAAKASSAKASSAKASPAKAPSGKAGAVSGVADAAIFAQCAGRRVDAANEFIGCPTFIASAHRPVGFSVDAALNTLVEDAKHGAYGDKETRTVTAKPYRLALDGQVLVGQRYTVERAGGARDHHVAVALEGRTGKLLIAHCQANGQLGQAPAAIDGICPAAMATILTGQVPANIYLAKAPYADGTLVGEALSTPKGCEREGDAQRIRCADGGQMTWYQAKTSIVPLAVVAQAKTQAITGSAKAEGVSTPEPEAILCTVAGVKTTCVHHRLDIEGEPAVHFYQARVDVRGDTLYAVCSGAGAAPDKPVPAPCGQVFDW
ncbi:MAG: hypothetical protein ACI9U2_004447 [Bradymonadia bacterium]|jgi:hypothetical protein